MATFQLYNYQFGKLGSEETPDLFGNKPLWEMAERNFPRRQAIFDDLLLHDYDKTESIAFTNTSGSREYAHMHLMSPADGIVILRVANEKARHITKKNFQIKKEYDYVNCLLIIDNRDGVQRIAIEQNTSVFTNTQTLANIFQHSMNKVLKQFGLHLELFNLQNAQDFWRCVNDRQEFPKGFYKLIFRLPHLNLERLTEKLDRIVTLARKSYDSDMTIEMTAHKGSCLHLDETDELQKAQIEFMTEQLGGDSITLVPMDDKKKRIRIGTHSQKTANISSEVFANISDDATSGNLFASEALDEVKQKLSIGL